MARKVRTLYKSQKKVLDRLKYYGILSVENLPRSVYNELVRLNSYENLDTDIERYLSDMYFERKYGKR